MNQVENPPPQEELLPIIKPLIIQILEEEILSKISNSTLVNSNANGNSIANENNILPNAYQINAQAIKTKELELIERVIRVEEQANYIREDIKKVHIDMKELRQDMDKRFFEAKQDMDKRFFEAKQDMDKRFLEAKQDTNKEFIAVRQEIKELRQDMKEEFIAVRQEIKELREDMDKKFDKQTNRIMTVFGIGITFVTTLITVFHFIK